MITAKWQNASQAGDCYACTNKSDKVFVIKMAARNEASVSSFRLCKRCLAELKTIVRVLDKEPSR